MASKKFIYGIAVVKFNSKEIGYIEKGSWDWGGTKPESTDVEAEQVPDAPVLTLANKNATIAPTFNLIQLDYENIQAVLGGTLVGSTGSYTGWKAPTDLVELRGPWEIQFVSGQQADADGGVEDRMPAESEQAGGAGHSSIRGKRHRRRITLWTLRLHA